MEKTNVMRLLDAAKISYVARSYNPEITDGKLAITYNDLSRVY